MARYFLEISMALVVNFAAEFFVAFWECFVIRFWQEVLGTEFSKDNSQYSGHYHSMFCNQIRF